MPTPDEWIKIATAFSIGLIFTRLVLGPQKLSTKMGQSRKARYVRITRDRGPLQVAEVQSTMPRVPMLRPYTQK